MTGLLGTAAVGAALMFTAGEAEARPVTIPGIGQFEMPEGIEFRPVTIPGIGNVEVPHMVSIDETAPAIAPEIMPSATADFETAPFETAPGTIPVAANPESMPAPRTDSTPATPSAPAAPEFRSVTVDGLGVFSVPNSLPPLAGIPGVTDAATITPAPAPAAPKTTGERAVEAAYSKLGAGYSSGGSGPDAFDCSGFVQWSYAQAGVDLPRTSYSQLNAGTPVSMDELQPGDLVSFYGGGHSALYVGDGQVIHASTYGSGVRVSPIENMPVSGARRF
ncbi:C40 family peptidase [Nocardia crassostreae]|uniref:C40 family peptidase n=1 Tax=Nocardia crassostreae TaxID=53428 RepID=UPI001FE184AE|nr:C40 family peptidase [Nocardia crassostreae]